MKLSKWLIAAILTASLVPHLYQRLHFNDRHQDPIDEDRMIEMRDSDLAADQTGFMVGVESAFVLTENIIHQRIARKALLDQAHFSTWRWRGRTEVAASAQGLDHLHHFVNSYLVGFKPFDTDKIWVPLYALAQKKQYQYDHLQYSGLADVWQNSIQAFYYTRGDCEDHAIALADWLIEMGCHARVVLGDYNGNGHAWVILFHEGQTYLLEATNKRRMKSLKHYPLAQLARGYHPRFQFDRQGFWVNTGSAFTYRYTGEHWVLRSRFKKGRTY